MAKKKAGTLPAGEDRGVGRPSAYQPEFAEQAYNLALLGATDEHLARAFHVSTVTINAWKQAHLEFLNALNRGRDIADANVGRRLYERAMGYSHKAVKIFADPKTGAEKIIEYTEHYAPDTTACIFWLKNRQRALWRDRIEHTGADGGAIKTEQTIKAENLPEQDREVLRAILAAHAQDDDRETSVKRGMLQ